MLAPALASCLALQVQQWEKQETCSVEGLVEDTYIGLHFYPICQQQKTFLKLGIIPASLFTSIQNMCIAA